MDITEFQQKFQIINTNNPGLINSSKGKDIVVVMGATGAGKSTLMNLLNDIPMTLHNFTDEFINSEDPNSFIIGQGQISQTLIPKYIFNVLTNTIMYDFAGWMDNREAIDNLIGAAFIKRIIENSKTCRFVFVISESDINSQRAINFTQFVSIAKKIVDTYDLSKMSMLVVTHANKVAREFKWEYLQQKLDGSFINNSLFGIWKESDIFPFGNGVIDGKQKLDILEKINLLDKIPVSRIDISHIYNGNVQKKLGDLFTFELKDIVDINFNKFNQLPTDDIIQISQAKDYLNNLNVLFNDKLNESGIINLFEPLCSIVYQEKLQIQIRQIEDFITQKSELLISKKQIIETEEKAKRELEEAYRANSDNWPREVKIVKNERETSSNYTKKHRTRNGGLFHGPEHHIETIQRTTTLIDTFERTIAKSPWTGKEKQISDKIIKTDSSYVDKQIGWQKC